MIDFETYIQADKFASLNGITFVEAGEDSATCSMRLSKDQVNSYNIAHGGAIFTLADTVFSIAANSSGFVTLAINVNISFIQGVTVGTLLTATATLISKNKRIAVFEIPVVREDGVVVANFIGTAYVKKVRVDENIGELA